MNIKQEKINFENERIVYVRSVNVDELPDEVRDRIDGLTELYALHSSDGERLALVKERELAFVLARQSDLSPVTVH
ncbi:MAG: hypothetical protein CL532_09320 [Aestuariivita sp.]|jgi:hypothetical protein|nr:hypothetical protein [Aestuariivita sp.]|tara:strand:+ start:744 stop:971 length:228 start_codon:yes stop_codon:yes gene_type:complete